MASSGDSPTQAVMPPKVLLTSLWSPNLLSHSSYAQTHAHTHATSHCRARSVVSTAETWRSLNEVSSSCFGTPPPQQQSPHRHQHQHDPPYVRCPSFSVLDEKLRAFCGRFDKVWNTHSCCFPHWLCFYFTLPSSAERGLALFFLGTKEF